MVGRRTGGSLVLVALLLRAPVDAQTVTVRVVAAETSAPLAGAIVQIESPDGSPVARALTDAAGRALFFQFGLGPHRAQAEMIGRETAESAIFEARPSERTALEIVLAPRPLELEGLEVEGLPRCRSGPGQGFAASRLWDEARKALTAQSIADEHALYRYQTLIYEQELDRDSRVVTRSRQSRREASMRSPFVSRPAGELITRGFVERSGNFDLYYGPDADVLLSDLFLETHCFGARAGEARSDTEGLVGLSFEPMPERRTVPEIAGTLWLDPGSSELRWLEYRYLNIDPEVWLDEVGGRVDFRQMPDGGWIVPRWWIRMPRISLQRTLDGDARRTYVAGFTESGGVVLDVQAPGRILGHDITGAIEGAVTDSLGRPEVGVIVEVVGTGLRTVTDSAGSFTLGGVVEGVYELRVSHPTLERLGLAPTSLTRAVVNGEVTLIDVAMPSAHGLLAGSCVAAPQVDEWSDLARELPSQGIVFGWVVDAETGLPVPGATVRVITPTVAFQPGASRTSSSGVSVVLGGVDLGQSAVVIIEGSVGLESRTDERGFYRFCGLPERHRLRLSAVANGAEIELDEFRIMEAAGQVERTIMVRRPG